MVQGSRSHITACLKSPLASRLRVEGSKRGQTFQRQLGLVLFRYSNLLNNCGSRRIPFFFCYRGFVVGHLQHTCHSFYSKFEDPLVL